jgi:hypothetical protein
MLLFMHHIALYTPCIALCNCGYILHIRVDHVEPKTDNQTEQVQWVFGDPQASSCEDDNLVALEELPSGLSLLNLSLGGISLAHAMLR